MEECKSIDEYIAIVINQIRSRKQKKQAIIEIKKEFYKMKKTYLYYGVDEETAVKRTIRRLGDPFLMVERFSCRKRAGIWLYVTGTMLLAAAISVFSSGQAVYLINRLFSL